MLDPAIVEPAPWANGAGSTRELAAAADPDGSTAWRISVADLDRDAPFSAFPGLDRVFVALGALRLTIDGAVRAMAAGDQVSFPGEAVVGVTLKAPTTALNVMTRRGRLRAAVVLRDPGVPASEDTDVSVRLAEVVADIRFHPSTKDTR